MSDHEISELYRLIRAQTDRIAELSITVARIEERLAARKECPEPGMCTELDERIDAIEKIHAEQRGGIRVALAIASGAGAAAAIVFEIVARKLGLL